jgi:hypothetical protein
MVRFYKAAIVMKPIGAAIQYKEPSVKGKIIKSVTDAASRGKCKLMVVDADDEQHRFNLALSLLEEVSESEAVELAKLYRPEKTLTRINRQTMKEEKVTVPTCDLKKYYSKEE